MKRHALGCRDGNSFRKQLTQTGAAFRLSQQLLNARIILCRHRRHGGFQEKIPPLLGEHVLTRGYRESG